MGLPRIPARRRVPAATLTVAAGVTVIVSVGNTRATEPANPEIPENAHAGTAAVCLSNSGIRSRSTDVQTAIISMIDDVPA